MSISTRNPAGTSNASTPQAAADHDPWRPRSEPAKSLYDAFQDEAMLRKSRSPIQWTQLEIDAVHREATRQASILGLRVPSRDEVAQAEIGSSGLINYGSNWAIELAAMMRKPAPGQLSAPANRKTSRP